MNLVNHDYIEFPFVEFDFSICERIPYKHQLETHPHMPKHVLQHICSMIPEDELKEIIDTSYYFLTDTYGEKSVQSQSDKKILIEDFPFNEIHDRAKLTVQHYLESAQGSFTFLFGNNQYRPPTAKLFQHAHAVNFIEGVENRRTFTVIYPLKQDLPVTEKFHIFHTDNTPWVENKDLYHMLRLPFITPVPDEGVVSIDFPKKGEMLLLEFNSVNGVHWIDGLDENNYMCHVFDAAILREPFHA